MELTYRNTRFKGSKNLVLPKKILEPSLNWHVHTRYGKSIGNPCIVKIENKYRLYYSASLSLIPDCGFCEPTYIGVAESNEIFGPYISLKNPLIFPNTSNRNLASGSIKVLKTENGFVGFENCIYQDTNGRSGSSIYLLNSFDGIEWDFLSQEPILSPSSGWMKSHIYAMDVKFHPIEKNGFYTSMLETTGAGPKAKKNRFVNRRNRINILKRESVFLDRILKSFIESAFISYIIKIIYTLTEYIQTNRPPKDLCFTYKKFYQRYRSSQKLSLIQNY